MVSRRISYAAIHCSNRQNLRLSRSHEASRLGSYFRIVMKRKYCSITVWRMRINNAVYFILCMSLWCLCLRSGFHVLWEQRGVRPVETDNWTTSNGRTDYNYTRSSSIGRLFHFTSCLYVGPTAKIHANYPTVTHVLVEIVADPSFPRTNEAVMIRSSSWRSRSCAKSYLREWIAYFKLSIVQADNTLSHKGHEE